MVIPHNKYLHIINVSTNYCDSGNSLALNDRPSRVLVCQNVNLSQSCHLLIFDLEEQFYGDGFCTAV